MLSSSQAGNSVTQALGFIRATFPSTALLIGGTLLEGKEPSGRYGVSLQVTRMPDQGSVLEDVWDTSWDSAVARAADAASAAILPRTRLCRGPWVTWRGYVMPADLLSSYERSLELGLKGDYKQALALGYKALKLDPLNRAVRLQIGKLEEQQKRYLNALRTYEGIVAAAEPDGGKLPRKLYSRRARIERSRMEHIARYRLIVLLGGKAIADEWSKLYECECGKCKHDECRKTEFLEVLVRICAAPKRARRHYRVAVERPIIDDCRRKVTIARASHSWLTIEKRKQRREEIDKARAPLEESLESAKRNRLDDIRCKLCERDGLLLPEAGQALADDLCRDIRLWRIRHPWGKSHLLTATVALAGACIEVRSEILEGQSPL